LPTLARVVMPPAFDNADEAIARVEEDVRRAQQRAARYPQLQAAIDAVRARATSPRRDLSVEVDAAGVLRDLTIDDDAFERGGAKVAQEILELIERARSDARRQTLAHTTELMGADDPIVKAVAADLEAQETGDHRWRAGGAR
jgi:DNA-binding protein YbaB